MNLIEKAFTLKKTFLFRDLGLDVLLAIADKMEEKSFATGGVIFRKGQDANRMYFVVTGSVSLSEEESGVMTPYDCFGDESLFSDKPRSYGATAREDSLLLSLSRTHLLAILTHSPAVGIRLLEAYSSALHYRHSPNK